MRNTHIQDIVPQYEDDESKFYSIMALNCALVVRKVKCASLINFRYCKDRKCNLWDKFNEDFKRKNNYLKFTILNDLKGEGRLVYFYDPVLLKNSLDNPLAQDILCSIGYERNKNLDYYINLLKLRFKDELPHEIGLFLGYEPEDVKLFIKEKKEEVTLKNAYYGYWKVYDNIEMAKKTFSFYDDIRRDIAETLACGICPKKFFLEDKLYNSYHNIPYIQFIS